MECKGHIRAQPSDWLEHNRWVVALIWALTNDPLPVVASQPPVAAQAASQTAPDNRLARTLGFVALTVAVLVIAIFVANEMRQTGMSTQDAALPSAQATSGGSQLSNASDGYHASDEVMTPYALSKNPYKWRRHSGILDTVNVPVFWGTTGVPATSIRYPGGALKFEKMIDEHTATYSVLFGEFGEGSLVPDGEIAVILPNSDPPDSSRPWRVFVEGPMEGSNALGTVIQVVTVRFEGCFVPPSPPVQARVEPTPVQIDASALSANQLENPQEPKPVRVESSSPPAQLPSIAEIDQQAIGLWNQKRYADALPLFNRACTAREADACYYLGVMFEFGHGVARDLSRERELYLKACQAGNRPACSDLDILQNYEPDLTQCTSPASAGMVSRATGSCNGGDGASCSTLAHLYSFGCGIAKDADRAQQLYSKACTIGDHEGCERLKEIQ